MGATVTGTLQDVQGNAIINGSLTAQLCGYGSQFPRYNGGHVIGNPEAHIQPSGTPPGSFEFELDGNDIVVPAGTYYTITVADENGDVVQCNAYQFLDGQTYDLNLIKPFDPNQPPPPLPPLITNQLLVVPWSATPEFPGDVYTAFRIILAGDVSSSTAPDTVTGNHYTFIIIQDATGGHAFTWPANSSNASPINPDPNAVTVQTFVRGLTLLVPIGPATWIG